MKSTLFGKIYRVVENPHEQDAAIEIIDGEYKGLVYQYGKVGFEEGKPNINFQRTIRRLPDSGEELDNLLNNGDLNKVMGDILVEIMQEQIRKEEENGEYSNENISDS
jgi:hypothetical protein|tara:strand:- start:7816 stop:8139 length:324 start_codon:yes stop_codon:yes gene_type:complete